MLDNRHIAVSDSNKGPVVVCSPCVQGVVDWTPTPTYENGITMVPGASFLRAQ